MAVIQAGKHPASRIEVGDEILERAKDVVTAPVKGRLAKFAGSHRAYSAAEKKVERADGALRKQQEKVAERDGDQDEAVMALASALAGDGLPRANPFRPFKFEAPSVIVKMAYAKEAKRVLQLAGAVKKMKGASKKSTAAAKTAEKAARLVQAALRPIASLEKKKTQAITRRDALGQPWETALGSLKRGARAAEDDGAVGLFAALFETQKRPARKPAATGAGTTGSPALGSSETK
ncbi:MAG: hypothetical protein HY720_17230 [Planctomycetes bacterium]|nr:hypothetical protein [Planctomycetota bacterium]